MPWINLVRKHGMVCCVKTLKGLCGKIMTFTFLVAIEKKCLMGENLLIQ